jgi:DNA-binding CsgD family transcriptional regulator/tetratricopeptide (TPR) repeat protein
VVTLSTTRRTPCHPALPPSWSRTTSTICAGPLRDPAAGGGAPVRAPAAALGYGNTFAVRSRLTSRRLVGRSGELAELELAVREAARGRPGLVLLGGDSGVGKTRLIAELSGRLVAGPGEPVAGPGEPAAGPTAPDGADPSPLLLRGDAIDQADGELPYVPLLGALRPVVRARHPALDALSPAARTHLATILPGLADAPGEPAEPIDGDQLRVFEAVLELLDRLAGERTVVLVLEDMHWADRSSRAFIAFLARALREERICLVLTYRSDELHRRHPLRPLLSELERLELTRALKLAPLDEAELAEALTDILGAPPSRELAGRLYARSEGNPLFFEELLAAGLDGRAGPPESLRDAFLSRIERLSDGAQAVAHAVAVGRALDEAAIAGLVGLDGERLRDALREAVAEQILVAGSEGRFCFRHALLREVVDEELLPGERVGLHLAIAQRLEAEPVPHSDLDALERAGAIAGHYLAAHDQPAALRSAVAAAGLAERALAYGEAAALLQRALELWPRVPDAVRVAGCDHAALLAQAASASSIIDERTRAEELLRAALGEVDPAIEPERHAELAGGLARVLFSLNRNDEAVRTARQALELIGQRDGSPARALLLAWLARNQVLRGRFRDAIGAGEAALVAARSVGQRRAEGEVLNTLGMAHVALGEVEPGLGLLRQAIAIAQDNDDPESEATAAANLADMLSQVGRTEAALEVARTGLRAAPIHLTRPRDWLRLTLSEMAFEAGDWALARQMLLPDPDRRHGILRMFGRLRQAELELGAGAHAQARRCLDSVVELVARSPEPQWIGLYGSLEAERRLRERDLDGARAVVRRALDRIELCTDDIVRIARISLVGATVEAEAALRARDLHESGLRRRALAEARIHVDRLAAAATDGGPVEAARLGHGRAELNRARGRAAVRQWRLAAAAWEGLARPYPAALARWREAEALMAAGERGPASAAAGQAIAAAEQLGAVWLAGEVRGLCDRARLRIPAAGSVANGAGAGAPGAGRTEDPFGLTPRERQVLSLLAEGATNRQIGAALFMAEKTASVHVSRILAKLGVRGRTEAAAVAHRQHLA